MANKRVEMGYNLNFKYDTYYEKIGYGVLRSN